MSSSAPAPIPDDFSVTTQCGLCYKPLLVPSEDPEEPDLADDVELPCHSTIGGLGHHFHWDCLIEANESGEWEGKSCPFAGGCENDVLNEEGRLLVRVANDGGVVDGFDLTEVLEDEEEDLGRRREMCDAVLFGQAASEGDLEDVEDLLKLGVNPNAIYDDDTKLTALHAAAMTENDAGYDIALALMKKGANPQLPTADGYTALDAAQLSRSNRVYALLLDPNAGSSLQ